MTRTKFKIALGAGAAALLAGGAIIIALKHNHLGGSHDNLHALKLIHDSQAAYAALSSYSDTGKGVEEGMGTRPTSTFSVHLARPDLYRVEWEETQSMMGMALTNNSAIWSAGDGDFRLRRGGAERVESRDTSFARASSATGTIPGDFFGPENHNSLAILQESQNLLLGNDETVGGVECHTVTGKRQDSGTTGTTTLWIGKTDGLIHQSKLVLEDIAAMEIPDSASARAKEALQQAKELSKGKPMIITITHENISVNKSFQKSDFVHEVPAGK